MSDWTGGYVSDVEYVAGFYRDQGPTNLDLACLTCGVEPPRGLGEDAPFTYCEIGCGHASTITALAASNPQGQFVGVDFMPAHIARAERFRTQAGLDNLRLIEADVVALADAAEPGLPRFDYVTLHGVYSWVSPEVRAGIVRFLDRFVKPGGVVYVSYNALPGWNQLTPAQRLLFEYARNETGDSTEQVRAAIGFVRRVLEAGSPAIHPEGFAALFAETAVKRLPQERVAYLAHEFLNTYWQPMYHMDLARELAGAKLSFVGQSNPIENFAGMGLTETAKALVEEQPEGALRETMKDYFNGRAFRRDVYVRGRRALAPDQRDDRLKAVMLALAARSPHGHYETEVLGSKIALNPDVYQPIFAALEQENADVDDLLNVARKAGGAPTAAEVLGMLSGLGMAMPVLRDVTTEAVAACRRHNATIAREAFRSTRQLRYALAVPVGHAGIVVSALEIAVLDGLFNGVPAEEAPLTAFVLRRTGVAADEVRSDSREAGAILSSSPPVAGSAPAPEDDSDQPMGERVRRAVQGCLDETLPYWQRLGLLDGA